MDRRNGRLIRKLEITNGTQKKETVAKLGAKKEIYGMANHRPSLGENSKNRMKGQMDQGTGGPSVKGIWTEGTDKRKKRAP